MNCSMFQHLFGLPDSTCEPNGFEHIILAIIAVLFGSMLCEIVKRSCFKKKFDENKWSLFCHGSLFGVGVVLFCIYPVLNQTFTWDNWPCQEKIIFFEVYFWLQTSFYTHLLINETSKPEKTDHTFLLHHIVTVILLFLSYMCSIIRFASQITFIHNISDVFLFAMKLPKSNEFLRKYESAISVLFYVSWFLTRLTCLPLYITPTALHQISILLNENYWWPFFLLQPPFALRILFFLFLSLLTLHFYWSVLVFCKGLRRVTN